MEDDIGLQQKLKVQLHGNPLKSLGEEFLENANRKDVTISPMGLMDTVNAIKKRKA